MAWRVGFGLDSAAASELRAESIGALVSSAITSRTRIPGSVKVPVLSTQMVSTRASTSTAGKS